jgi:hypothetical protein
VTQPEGDTPDRSLAARYGRPSATGRRTGVLVVALAALALGAWAVWAALGQSQGAVGAIVQSYRVTSPHEMSVTVQVTRQSTDPVHCVVSAIATDHSAVGETVVTLPAGPSGTTTVTATVRTERIATSADVGHCR